MNSTIYPYVHLEYRKYTPFDSRLEIEVSRSDGKVS